MSFVKRYRPFIDAIKPYGLYTEISKKHLKAKKGDVVVASMSVTPGDVRVAVDHTLRFLIKNEHLPKVNRRHYVHELKKAQHASTR